MTAIESLPPASGVVLSLLTRFFSVPALALVLFTLGLAPKAAALSESDARIYRSAFAEAKEGNWSRAWQEASAGHDRLLATALQWLQLRQGGSANLADYAAFLETHPDWPSLALLRQRAEAQMATASDAAVAQWFAAYKPITVAGRLRLAELWQDRGQAARAVELIREIWVESDLSSLDEKLLLERFHRYLRPIDQERRLDRLLWDGETAEARRMLPRVSPAYRALAEVRLDLAALAPGVEHRLARLPASLLRDPGLLYERVRWRRRRGHYDDAIALLESLPREHEHAAQWAIERQVLARYALSQGKPALAYRLASRQALTNGPSFADLEFFSGWLALRYLHRPELAYSHFLRLYDASKMPISLGRGAYWAARAAEAMGNHALADKWYDTAAGRITTYYGQLAAARLGLVIGPARFAEPRPGPGDVSAFDRRELVRVARELATIGADQVLNPFFHRLSELATTPVEHELVARLALEINRPDLAVAAAKAASYSGVTLLDEGYPITRLPPGGTVERPLILAMTRQESAFDQGAVSSAGARGLMQLLPATARLVAKSLQIPFSKSRLTDDTRYNLMLGRAYLAGLLGDFSGSYVLAVAAYNAGPARVHQWIQDFGDPRARKVDVIDWIEAIPVAETRNYVQRVMENLQIYRLRLGDRRLAFSLASDLRR